MLIKHLNSIRCHSGILYIVNVKNIEIISFFIYNKNGGSMSEFISILISFIFMSLAESVDSFFNNKISIDAIIVCSSLFSINLLGKSLGELGTYTYRVIRKKEFSYLAITGIVSLFAGIFIFFTRDLFINLFNMSLEQKELLSNLLALYIIYFPD